MLTFSTVEVYTQLHHIGFDLMAACGRHAFDLFEVLNSQQQHQTHSPNRDSNESRGLTEGGDAVSFVNLNGAK